MERRRDKKRAWVGKGGMRKRKRVLREGGNKKLKGQIERDGGKEKGERKRTEGRPRWQKGTRDDKRGRGTEKKVYRQKRGMLMKRRTEWTENTIHSINCIILKISACMSVGP